MYLTIHSAVNFSCTLLTSC